MCAEPTGPAGTPALRVRGLTVRTAKGTTLVSDVDLDLAPGATLGIVGESGCGKTTTLRAIAGLLAPGLSITGGEIEANGRMLTKLRGKELDAVRGREVGVIWQDPLAALDPVIRVGHQIAEVVRAHERISASAAKTRAIELMSLVELPRTQDLFHSYPHQLSGGQRQRVVIAAALAAGPALLLADEPTTALDVTVQQQILRLFARLREELGLTLVIVSHDLAVVGEVCERVAIMYGGRVIEVGTTKATFTRPRHHYTAALLKSVPSVATVGHRPVGIGGNPPASVVSDHCSFAPRCAAVQPTCRTRRPELTRSGPDQQVVACFYPVPDPVKDHEGQAERNG
ncbi:MAG TPA: ABC transporter ATP-binding protein [Streptosporangiaceae bacterium]|nr:ABC transporter ATP-binding protein [Streptosporangiaceae bacterium]